MGHDHSHHHHHPKKINLNRAVIVGIALNFSFVVIEAIAGLWTHSLALLTDAGHNLSDVVSLGLILVASKMSEKKASDQFTYGFKKTTVVVALFNATLLLVALGAISLEAIQRFSNPQIIQGKTIALVALIGIIINGGTAFLFVKGREKDLNIKGAYLHMLTDALVSAGVVVAGILIMYTGWFWLDSIISLIITILILFSTWSLFKEALWLSLDAVPKDIKMKSIQNTVLGVNGVKNFHHIHIWALSTTETALTGHIVVKKGATLPEIEEIKNNVRHELEHASISHVTLEIEGENESQTGEAC